VEMGDLSRRAIEPYRTIAGFHTMAAAKRAGKAALKQLLSQLDA
jgi:hypothetical protein